MIFLSSCKQKSIIDQELVSLNLSSKDYYTVDTFFYSSKNISSLRFKINDLNYVNTSFFESGKKKSIAPVSNGQCHNEYIDWHENGEVQWIRKYINGNQIGNSTKYRMNGVIEWNHNNYTNEVTEFWENGKPKFKFIPKHSASYHYGNGQEMEKYKNLSENEYEVDFFNENGSVVFSGLYKKNILYQNESKFNGKITSYFNNGKRSMYQNVINGIPEGKFFAYYGNGKLKYESEVRNGEETYYKAYHENGNVDFIRDGINNTFTQWDEYGNLTK